MTEVNLIEKKELREQMAGRVEVLDKVKELFLMPKLDMLTTQQVADYYEVDIEVVQKCYLRNKNEINSDGVQKYSAKCINERFGQDVQIVKTKYYQDFQLSSEVVLRIPNVGIKLFSKRAILRIGMLLRDSEIAKEVRTQLLNTFEHSTTEEKTQDINEETGILLNLAKALTMGTKEDYVYASKDYFDFQNRHISALKDSNSELASNNKALAGEILEWCNRSKLNRAIRLIASARNTKFQYVWKELYDELLYKYHIGLAKRGEAPFIQHIREDEWKFVLQSISAICENSGVSPSKIFEKAKMM